ncbi:MAG: DUF1080 domain-containing protein [Acidobacteria bacterium]|nr:DUF1080 domain-containing protein [Acidobacteriota bacterium]
MALLRTLLWCALCSGSLSAEDGFRPLFNGKNLAGWEEDTPGIWKAHNGMIVGKSPGLDHSEFLRSKKMYSDFVLKLSFHLVDAKGNTGVQFRSKAVPNSHIVLGYQADVIPKRCWGCLYDELRRKFLVSASPESMAAAREDDWNDLVVTARGNHITIDVNGTRAVDYRESDPGIDASGILALQVHGGPPMEVRFKDLRIRDLTE